ncbi:MAG: hypothetical protein AAGA27_06225 [Pseudomonadota bacterium]
MLKKCSQLSERLYKISVAPDNEFTFNHFLLVDDYPIWFHCGRTGWFKQVSQYAQQILNKKQLAYIAFSHFEADETAALNHWIAKYPAVIPLVGRVGEASISDFSNTKPKIFDDNETLNLGNSTLHLLETPHCPHNWDACMFYDEKDKILFCSDLGTNMRSINNIISDDSSLIDDIIASQQHFGYLNKGHYLKNTLDRLTQLDIDILAIQHGEMLRGKKNIQALFERLYKL